MYNISHKLHVSFESKSTLALINYSRHKDIPVKCRALKSCVYLVS